MYFCQHDILQLFMVSAKKAKKKRSHSTYPSNTYELILIQYQNKAILCLSLP